MAVNPAESKANIQASKHKSMESTAEIHNNKSRHFSVAKVFFFFFYLFFFYFLSVEFHLFGRCCYYSCWVKTPFRRKEGDSADIRTNSIDKWNENRNKIREEKNSLKKRRNPAPTKFAIVSQCQNVKRPSSIVSGAVIESQKRCDVAAGGVAT